MAPQPAHYDLVVPLYVHVADSAETMVQRLAAGMAGTGVDAVIRARRHF